MARGVYLLNRRCAATPLAYSISLPRPMQPAPGGASVGHPAHRVARQRARRGVRGAARGAARSAQPAAGGPRRARPFGGRDASQPRPDAPLPGTRAPPGRAVSRVHLPPPTPTLQVHKGDTVAIWGAGPVGILAAHCALYRGARRVVLVRAPHAGRRVQSDAACPDVDRPHAWRPRLPRACSLGSWPWHAPPATGWPPLPPCTRPSSDRLCSVPPGLCGGAPRAQGHRGPQQERQEPAHRAQASGDPRPLAPAAIAACLPARPPVRLPARQTAPCARGLVADLAGGRAALQAGGPAPAGGTHHTARSLRRPMRMLHPDRRARRETFANEPAGAPDVCIEAVGMHYADVSTRLSAAFGALDHYSTPDCCSCRPLLCNKRPGHSRPGPSTRRACNTRVPRAASRRRGRRAWCTSCRWRCSWRPTPPRL